MLKQSQHENQNDRDFKIGNFPEWLNVTASEGAPAYLDTCSLELKQDVDQFGLAGKIWQSAYMLQTLFSPDTRSTIEPSNPIPKAYYNKPTLSDDTGDQVEKPFRILELGAGTGYVGIALARQLRKPAQVYITDIMQVVPLIQENVKLHISPNDDDGSAAEVIVDRLHWGNREDAKRLVDQGRFDLVVVSDCVYFPELFGMLLDTLLDVCDACTRVVIGYKCRSLEKELGFWQDYFGRYFEYEPVRKLVSCRERDEEGNTVEKQEIGAFLGAEDQLFVFIGTKRKEHQVKTADDTFTTLLFCSMET
ncbi:putative methyltransferase-domain-containing protein [Parasitella parasitica]|nr:putative methyltransferase-domain-containing protein [Parasitella parasitica]